MRIHEIFESQKAYKRASPNCGGIKHGVRKGKIRAIQREIRVCEMEEDLECGGLHPHLQCDREEGIHTSSQSCADVEQVAIYRIFFQCSSKVLLSKLTNFPYFCA